MIPYHLPNSTSGFGPVRITISGEKSVHHFFIQGSGNKDPCLSGFNTVIPASDPVHD